MFSVNESKDVINFEISSEMRMVDHVMQECREFFKKCDVNSFSNSKVVIRELLINAIEHGNRNIVESKINFKLEHLNNFRFKVEVQDQGDGFDYKSLNMEMPDDPEQVRYRGYALINAFTEKIEFNGKGNVITTYLNLKPETTYQVTSEGEWTIVKPAGSITATTADRFRITLLNLLKEKKNMYRLDFNDVEEIDSISLSVLVCFAKMIADEFVDNFKLEIINTNKDLISLFKMTRMDRKYNISPKV